jgi:hypothetical protein
LAIWEKVLGPEHMVTNHGRRNFATLLLATGHASTGLGLGQAALAIHNKVLGPKHSWTKDTARVTADALTALGRDEEATALRERLGFVAE